MNIEQVKVQAEKELADELFRKAVDEYKFKLKNRKTLWDKFFPYRIILIKKGE